ncbi:hypothetical protein ACFLTL_00880 [Chloroflexota bacterium]
MNKRKLIAIATSIALVLIMVLTANATIAQADRTFDCLNPKAEPGEARVIFTGTLDDAQDFYQQTMRSATLGNVEVAQYTDGLPIIIPTEEDVIEVLTGTSHSKTEVMSVYTKNTSGQWIQGTSSTRFQPSGNTVTVEQVAVNAVMAGCKAEYLPAVLAMMSGGPNYVDEVYPIGYWQFVAGPFAKEVGFNTGQGAMNASNPPSMTIGRAFQLCLINLGGAIAGSTNANMGTLFNRSMLCLAEDPDDLPEGWVGANEDCGLEADESMIMLCQSSSMAQGNFAPSSYRSMNSGHGGIANRLGAHGQPGFYNPIEYLMQLTVMPDKDQFEETVIAGGIVGPTGPLVIVGPPSCLEDLRLHGFATKNEFYQWVEDRGAIPLSEYKKYGWYDAHTDFGLALEPKSGRPYMSLADDYPIHVLGTADQQLIFPSIYPGDESLFAFSGGRGAVRSIDAWR